MFIGPGVLVMTCCLCVRLPPLSSGIDPPEDVAEAVQDAALALNLAHAHKRQHILPWRTGGKARKALEWMQGRSDLDMQRIKH